VLPILHWCVVGEGTIGSQQKKTKREKKDSNSVVYPMYDSRWTEEFVGVDVAYSNANAILHDYISTLSANIFDGISDGQSKRFMGDSRRDSGLSLHGSLFFEVRQVMLFLWLMLDVDVDHYPH
jgi:hypothetical protein